MCAPKFTSLLLLLASAPSISAFGVTPRLQGNSRIRSSPALYLVHGDDCLERRDVLTWLGAAALLVSSTPAQARDFYLQDPTEEFKESEKQRAEFRQKQLAIKKRFTTVLDRLSNESKTEEQLVKDLEELRGLVIETGGLPLGIQKEGMYKQIRSKKAAGFWPTNVEIAYQSLKIEVSYQQSPNTEKDTENPL